MKGNYALFGTQKKEPIPSGVTNSQRLRIERGYRKIRDHLTKKDIDGAIKDIKGNPIQKPDGNGSYQHYKEVDDAVRGLIKEKDSLIKSIQNPNLKPDIKDYLKSVIHDFEIKIDEWNRIKGRK